MPVVGTEEAMKTHMAGILQAEPSSHGTARNPQISIVNPSLEPHFRFATAAICAQGIAAVDATHYLKWLTNSEETKSKRVEGEEKLSG